MKTSATPSSSHTVHSVTAAATPSLGAVGTAVPQSSTPSPPSTRDRLGEDVRSSLLLLGATAMFAFAVVALGTLAAGIPG